MTILDTLSCNLTFVTSTDFDLEYTLLLSDQLFISSIDLFLQKQIKEATEVDLVVQTALEQLIKNGPAALTAKLSDWKVCNKLTFYKGKCYVSSNLALRRDLVQQYHNLKHNRILRTLEQIHPHYWWLGIAVFIPNYVKGCSLCQQNKVNTHLP